MSSESSRSHSASFTPPRYTTSFAALNSLRMPSRPNTSTPCAYDWKIDMTGIPREPRCEYRSGSSFHRHTFAASSSTHTSGVDRRPPGCVRARRSAASTIATVSAVTSGAAVPSPSTERE
ncbi:hypothetical protein CMMCAS05_06260 [Clavibacter michiganensis subsp. michiganensis]|nr:hypothetical protein CMMCAS04_12825 [Clavibacter michiganensis subsp. michiganensis]OUD93202.1 hypothetical protein CMMCAS05_06260 [Clavibacter michiganensis subsp. michiganensis]